MLHLFIVYVMFVNVFYMNTYASMLQTNFPTGKNKAI